MIRLVSDQCHIDIAQDGGDLFAAMTRAIISLPTGQEQTNLHFEVDQSTREALDLQAIRDPKAVLTPATLALHFERSSAWFKKIPIDTVEID
jgi:hypothetical protein